MRFQGALIREQGVTFAIAVVKKHVLDNKSQAEETIAAFRPIFGNVPIVLMAQDSRGVPTYYGRKDIANFMARVPLHTVPWKEYTVS